MSYACLPFFAREEHTARQTETIHIPMHSIMNSMACISSERVCGETHCLVLAGSEGPEQNF